MGRARDARVVVTDGLLALPAELVNGQVDPRRHERTQIVLNGTLILSCRRRNVRVLDEALVIDGVAMIEYAARRFVLTDSMGRTLLRKRG